MMEEDDHFDLFALLERFETLLDSHSEMYHDLDEYELVTDYYAEMGKPKKALRILEMALTQHPYAPVLRVRKVQVLSAVQRFREAREELEALSRQAPDSYELYTARAGFYSRNGQHQKAIQCYQKALPLAEFPEDVHSMLAVEHQLLGQYAEAIQFLRKVLIDNPQDEVGLYNIALCYDMLSRYEEGITFFEDFIERSPYSEVAWYHLGMFFRSEREFDKALWAMDYAILIDEYFSAVYFEKAEILESTYRFQEAIDTYQETIRFEGPSGYAYYRIAGCYQALHNRPKAIAYYTKAVQEDEELDGAYHELALLSDEDEQWEQAIYFINRALELDPENISYLFISADIHRRGGRLDEAAIFYDTLEDAGVNEAKLYIDYAELLFDMCEFEPGMEKLYEGVRQQPESPEMNLRLAGYLLLLDEQERGANYLKKGLELDGGAKFWFIELFPRLRKHPIVDQILRSH
ncbi:MAG: tetratricopeptide repeat protein [Schleiferiaceae bacterium]|nr:tetratricopeptide repeat protein [Schleiferiaceae bacterium]